MPWYATVRFQGIKGSNFDRRWLLSSSSPENASYYLRLQSALPQEADPSHCTSHAGVDELP